MSRGRYVTDHRGVEHYITPDEVGELADARDNEPCCPTPAAAAAALCRCWGSATPGRWTTA